MKAKFFCYLLLLIACSARSQSVSPFKAGDRVVFIGNSITDGGRYHSYIWLYYMTHFPNTKISVFNAGIGGDIVGQMYRRLDYDVFPHKPTVVALTFGMNDTGYYDFLKKEADSIAAVRIKESLSNYKKIEARFRQYPAIKKVLISSSPYDETSKFTKNNLFPGKSIAMRKVADFQKASAEANGWGFVDFNAALTAINTTQQAKDSNYTISGGDRIHPGNDGHLAMAATFLQAQGLAGKVVADVVINAATGKEIQSTNCMVSSISTSGKDIAFDYLANSLPFPVDTTARGWNEKRTQADALKVIPFMAEFNQELLAIKNLASGQYQLQIDGQVIGSWSSEEWGQGINLANQTRTPQYQQAIAIRELNEERWEIERRLRQRSQVEFNLLYDRGLHMKDDLRALDTVLAYAPKDWTVAGNKDVFIKARFPEVRATWIKQIDVLVNTIYSMNKPKRHRILIKAVNGKSLNSSVSN